MKFCSNTSEIDSHKIKKLEDFNFKECAFFSLLCTNEFYKS